MKFGGIQRCSTIDFPGTLSCVLFTRGCDLNCFYCHNRALLDGSGPVVASEEIWAFLKKRRGLLGGVVLSGGNRRCKKISRKPSPQSGKWDTV